MHRPLTTLGLGVALLLASGCARISEITYPGLDTNVPQDMYMDAGGKRFLWICLNTTNVVGVVPPASFLTDSHGRRYRLEFDTLAIHKNQLRDGLFVQSQYHIISYSLEPSPRQLDFDSGSYSISLSYTNAGSTENLVIDRRFVIRWHFMNPIVWIQWLIHGD